MDTVHLTAKSSKVADVVKDLAESLAERLNAGQNLVVTIAEEDEKVSPAVASERLGFSRQHLMRLVAAGEIQAELLPGSTHRKIPVSALVEFEERRSAAREAADAFSRSLDDAGAPLE